VTLTDVDELCTAIRGSLVGDPRGIKVAKLLEDYALHARDWRAFCHFAEGRYTRNLVYRCAEFELLLLCWGAGHESPIHCHDGQDCWMAVLDGELEEVHFRQRRGPGGALAEGRTSRFQRGGVAFIHDAIALHLIRPAPRSSGVSLHLYAGAIDRCRVFERETGRSELVTLGYDTVRGEVCTKPPEAVRAEWGRGGPPAG